MEQGRITLNINYFWVCSGPAATVCPVGQWALGFHSKEVALGREGIFGHLLQFGCSVFKSLVSFFRHPHFLAEGWSLARKET